MLIKFAINSIDTFNVIYLWTLIEKKNNNILKLLSSIIVISVVMTITEKVGLSSIVFYVIEILIIKIIYKSVFRDAIFGFVLSVLMNMFLQLIIQITISSFIYDYIIRGFIIDSTIMLSIIIFSKLKPFSKYPIFKKITFDKLNSNILIFFISTWSIYVIVSKFIWDYDNGIIQSNLFVTVGIFSILMMSQAFTYLYIVKVIKEKEKFKISNEYNSVISEIVQEIKQRQHDFINYKNTIKGIIDVVDEEEIKDAVNNYIKDEDVYDNKINELIYIDNVVIRSVIYRNMCRFKKHNIDFKYKIENNVLDDFFSYHEMSNILNNLLNNAFEEVIKEECIEKDIEIEIFNKNKTSHLVIKNQIVDPNNINLNEMFSRGYSSKNNASRGYGLYNVQAIVNLHKGHIKINIESGKIIFDIYFNKSSG